MLLLDARSVQLLVFGIVGVTLVGVFTFIGAMLYERFREKGPKVPSRL